VSLKFSHSQFCSCLFFAGVRGASPKWNNAVKIIQSKDVQCKSIEVEIIGYNLENNRRRQLQRM
jgi:hypothetical protein